MPWPREIARRLTAGPRGDAVAVMDLLQGDACVEEGFSIGEVMTNSDAILGRDQASVAEVSLTCSRTCPADDSLPAHGRCRC